MVDLEKISEEIEDISANKIKSIELILTFKYESPRRPKKMLITKNPLDIAIMIGGYKFLSGVAKTFISEKLIHNLLDIMVKKSQNIDKEVDKNEN